MVEVMKIIVTSFPRPCKATTDLCLPRRLLDTQGQVWVSLLWGHWSFLLGSDVHKVLFVPSKSLFPQSCASSGVSAALLLSHFSCVQLCVTP